MERTAASALFATPPTSSFEEALEYFLACNDMVQGKVRYVSICSSNYLLLGQTYEGLKNTDQAKVWYQKCIDLKQEGAGTKVDPTIFFCLSLGTRGKQEACPREVERYQFFVVVNLPIKSYKYKARGPKSAGTWQKSNR